MCLVLILTPLPLGILKHDSVIKKCFLCLPLMKISATIRFSFLLLIVSVITSLKTTSTYVPLPGFIVFKCIL